MAPENVTEAPHIVSESDHDDIQEPVIQEEISSAPAPKIAINSPKLEEMLAHIASKQKTIPNRIQMVPARKEHVLNDAYLNHIDALHHDYRECCAEYLTTTEPLKSTKNEIKHLNHLKRQMDSIEKMQKDIDEHYIKTLLMFDNETKNILDRLHNAHSLISSLSLNSIIHVIRANKHNFFKLILEHKKCNMYEMTHILKAIFTHDKAAPCLDVVLDNYEIDQFLLRKDDNHVLLASYLFRLPRDNDMRLTLAEECHTLSSPAFYQQLKHALDESQKDHQYDEKAITRDIEHADIAQAFYIKKQQKETSIKEIEQAIFNLTAKSEISKTFTKPQAKALSSLFAQGVTSNLESVHSKAGDDAELMSRAQKASPTPMTTKSLMSMR